MCPPSASFLLLVTVQVVGFDSHFLTFGSGLQAGTQEIVSEVEICWQEIFRESSEEQKCKRGEEEEERIRQVERLSHTLLSLRSQPCCRETVKLDQPFTGISKLGWVIGLCILYLTSPEVVLGLEESNSFLLGQFSDWNSVVSTHQTALRAGNQEPPEGLSRAWAIQPY